MRELTIKFEIGLRFNPFEDTQKHNVNHCFLHPFTGQALFDAGKVNCLSLKELVAEKLRAAAIRPVIAPRDFYDIDFILRNNFNMADVSVAELFRKKLEEDNADTDLNKYKINLSRSDQEIKDMKSRINVELFDVLTPNALPDSFREEVLKEAVRV